MAFTLMDRKVMQTVFSSDCHAVKVLILSASSMSNVEKPCDLSPWLSELSVEEITFHHDCPGKCEC